MLVILSALAFLSLHHAFIANRYNWNYAIRSNRSSIFALFNSSISISDLFSLSSLFQPPSITLSFDEADDGNLMRTRKFHDWSRVEFCARDSQHCTTGQPCNYKHEVRFMTQEVINIDCYMA